MTTTTRRASWIEPVKAGLLVTSIAALVWLFAEARSLSERSLEVRVEFVAPAQADLLVEPADQSWTGSVRLRLEGARAALDETAAELAGGVRLALGSPGVPSTPGRQVVDLREALRENPPLDRAGVTILTIDPQSVALEIESLVAIEDVEVIPELPGVQTVEDPTLEPDRVRLVLPESVVRRVRRSPEALYAIARPAPGALENMPAGERHTIEARVQPPAHLTGARFVRVEPRTVNLTVMIRSRTDSYVVRSVPIWPMVPPTEINRWNVSLDPMFLQDVRISGPSDLVQRVRENEVRVIAAMRLTSDDLENRIESKTPEFLPLPEKLTVESEIEPVNLTIERRPEPDS